MVATKPKTYLARLDEIPPPLCRLIARSKGHQPRILTITEIAAASGLPWQRVAWIARQKSFASVTVADADKFRLGCGITPENEKRHREFIRRNYARTNAWVHIFKMAKRKWPASWRAKFVTRIVNRL